MRPSESYKILSTADQRLEFIRTQRRCFRSVKKNNLSKTYYSKNLVHSAVEDIKSRGTEANRSRRGKYKQDKYSNGEVTTSEDSALFSLTHTSQDTYLLQSALVNIAAGTKCFQASLLFDSRWISAHVSYLPRSGQQERSPTA